MDKQWIEWTGGECPVQMDDLVTVRLRNGTEYNDLGSELKWSHGLHKMYREHEIIAYRVSQ